MFYSLETLSINSFWPRRFVHLSLFFLIRLETMQNGCWRASLPPGIAMMLTLLCSSPVLVRIKNIVFTGEDLFRSCLRELVWVCHACDYLCGGLVLGSALKWSFGWSSVALRVLTGSAFIIIENGDWCTVHTHSTPTHGSNTEAWSN